MLDRYQTFIFDLDGTLVDSVPDLALALNHALNEQHLESVTQQQVRQWVGNGSKKLVERALYAIGQWSETQQQSLHKQFLLSYEEFLNRESQLYPKTLELLQTLKANHKTLALLTNKPIQFVKPLLSALGIVEHFSFMLGGDSLPEKKPSPLPLLHIMESLEQSPEQCVMIGDSRSDVLCAQAAHVDCILLEQGYNQGLDLSQLNPTLLLTDTSVFLEELI